MANQQSSIFWKNRLQKLSVTPNKSSTSVKRLQSFTPPPILIKLIQPSKQKVKVIANIIENISPKNESCVRNLERHKAKYTHFLSFFYLCLFLFHLSELDTFYLFQLSKLGIFWLGNLDFSQFNNFYLFLREYPNNITNITQFVAYATI